MKKSFKINGREIGQNFPPFIIAEISANHNGSIDNAKKLILLAKQAGADAVKLQSYTADTITLNSDREEFKIKGGLWDGQTLYDLYKKAYMPWEWHKPLFEYAKDVGITIFSSPFDNTAVDMLEELEAPAYKIASFEAIDLPLIRYVAQKKKPMIISTGMANQQEIQEAIDTALSAGCQELAILHCVSGYPTPAHEYNLVLIPDMIKNFKLVTGLSDHTIDNTTALTSVALGASIIEKHFTLDRNGGGPDDSFSLEFEELKALCNNAKTAWQALGQVDYGLKSSEKSNVQFRRSLYFIKDMDKGEIITNSCIKSVRPGNGLAPKYWDEIIGKPVKSAIKSGTPTSTQVIDID